MYLAVVQERLDVSVKYPASVNDALARIYASASGIQTSVCILAFFELVQAYMFVSVMQPASLCLLDALARHSVSASGI